MRRASVKEPSASKEADKRGFSIAVQKSNTFISSLENNESRTESQHIIKQVRHVYERTLNFRLYGNCGNK